MGPASGVNPLGANCGIVCFSTSNFDAMKRFLSAVGFVVAEGKDQLLPMFSEGRGARVSRGNFQFNLEEDPSRQRVADFNMLLLNLSEEEIKQAKSSGFEFTSRESLYGSFYTFKSPDGGTFVIH
jgi:hypothetical protein